MVSGQENVNLVYETLHENFTTKADINSGFREAIENTFLYFLSQSSYAGGKKEKLSCTLNLVKQLFPLA